VGASHSVHHQSYDRTRATIPSPRIANGEFVTESGALITVAEATAEKGRIMAVRAVADIAKAVRLTFGLPPSE
jgi:hypothetical protein